MHPQTCLERYLIDNQSEVCLVTHADQWLFWIKTWCGILKIDDLGLRLKILIKMVLFVLFTLWIFFVLLLVLCKNQIQPVQIPEKQEILCPPSHPLFLLGINNSEGKRTAWLIPMCHHFIMHITTEVYMNSTSNYPVTWYSIPINSNNTLRTDTIDTYLK